MEEEEEEAYQIMMIYNIAKPATNFPMCFGFNAQKREGQEKLGTYICSGRRGWVLADNFGGTL